MKRKSLAIGIFLASLGVSLVSAGAVLETDSNSDIEQKEDSTIGKKTEFCRIDNSLDVEELESKIKNVQDYVM